MSARARRQPRSKDQKELQNVFKVQGFHPPRIDHGALEGGPAQDTHGASVFRPRRSHTKSRTGCGQCRRRRVKCDENRDGGCARCRNRGVECDYLRSQPVLHKRLVPFPIKDHISGDADSGSSPSAPSSHCQESQTQTTSDSEDHSPRLLISPSPRSMLIKTAFELTPRVPQDMTSHLATLHHFEAFTSHTCGSPLGQSILRSYMIAVAGKSPYLMHAMLGIAAAHMAYLLPAKVNAVQHARNSLAEAWHWGHALTLFRKELGADGNTGGAGKSNMDALLSTIMMVAVHQFMLHDEDERSRKTNDADSWNTSFVFIEDGDERSVAMKWLTIQAGFKLLLRQLERYLAESAWLPVFEDADPHQHFNMLRSIDNSNEVERLLCQYCNIDAQSTEENNVYYGPLETVICVRRLRPMRAELFNKLITVMGRITPKLQHLIWMRDTRALLILCHWLSLMAELKQWWITARAESECRAIIFYLLSKQAKGGEADLVRSLLEEPARVVGLSFATQHASEGSQNSPPTSPDILPLVSHLGKS